MVMIVLFRRSIELDFEEEEDFLTESSVNLEPSQECAEKKKSVYIKRTAIETTGITFHLLADEVRGNKYVTVLTDHRYLSFRSILAKR